jgi:hypothetical protein
VLGDTIKMLAVAQAVEQGSGGEKRIKFSAPSSEPSISMPGLPDDVLLTNLYTMGALKYDAFIGFMSKKHSIPIDAFEETPALSVKEAAGVDEEPSGTAEAAGGLKASKSSNAPKSKPKAKSSSSKSSK